MASEGSPLLIFIIFAIVAIIIASRAIARKERKKRLTRKRVTTGFQQQNVYTPPWQPYHSTNRSSSYHPSRSTTPTTASTPYSPQYAARRQYATAEEYFREGLYDQAKEEYLKTGRIFGAAKAVAAKGHDYIEEAIELIKRYAPEREEEMVRNLSRYFFDSGDIETAAIILYQYGLKDEAEAVLATIGKTYEDIIRPPPVEVMHLPAEEIEPTVKTAEDVITKSEEAKEAMISKPIEPFVPLKETKDTEAETKEIKPQKIRLATVDLNENCSVCMQQIKAGDSFVRCPFCDAAAHYSHLIEWIKVKPQCPNCRKKLVAKMFETQ